MEIKKIPTIALVGRTNVGKSTLFNRLIEQPKALVSKVHGTTRDRNEGECLWRGKQIRIVDTGGIDVDPNDEIDAKTLSQAMQGIEKADVILFLLDMKSGPLPQDHDIAKMLRDLDKPVLVIANKTERASERNRVLEPQWRLEGLPSPFPISSIRGTGVGDMLDLIYDTLNDLGVSPVEPYEIDALKIAVIGKPNVGKSSILNEIMGEERFITSPIAHTTREPNDTLIEIDDKKYLFIDTAGMRKRSKVKRTGGLEAQAVRRSEKMVQKADITLFVIDANEPIGTQERTLAGFLKKSDSGIIAMVNKWDLVKDKTTGTMNQYRDYIAAHLPFLKWAPVMFVSALTGQRIKNVFEWIEKVEKHRTRQFSEEELSDFIQLAAYKHKPTKGKGPKPPKILGLTQTSTKPPTFDLTIKAKRTDVLHPSYVSYLQNRMREHFGLIGTPIHIHVRTASSVSK